MRTSYVTIALTLAAALFVPTIARAFGIPEMQCQAAKNKIAGDYAACRHKAEANFAMTKFVNHYEDALNRCERRLANAWQGAEQRAANAGTTCLDAPLTVNDFRAVIDVYTGSVATALRGDGLANCPADLARSRNDFAACEVDLGACIVGAGRLAAR